MELRVLKYFLAAAEEENITRAAERVNTSQPNLSKQLVDLENELGKKLFVREKSRVHLTKEGLYLRKRAKEIIDLSDRTAAEISLLDGQISGTVHIGAAETGTMRFISKSMEALRQQHPALCFNIFSGSTVEVTEYLEKGLLDFGIIVSFSDTKQWDFFELPVKDVFGVLMRKDSPLAERKQVTPSDIRGKPLIVAHQQLESSLLSLWLGTDIKTQNIVSTFNLITTPTMMIEAGLGYAFTFDNLVYTGRDSPLTFRPLNPPLDASLFLVWKKYQTFTNAGSAFFGKNKIRF